MKIETTEMRRLRPVAALSFIAFLLVFLCAGSGSAKVIPMGIEQMARAASWIIEGTVTDVRSQRSSDGGLIYTFVTIDIEDTLKGPSLGATLRLRLLGGVVDGVGMSVEDNPVFSQGEKVVVFLGPNPQAFFPTVGLQQGVFKVFVDPSTGHEMVASSVGVLLAKLDFEARIRRALG